MNIEPTQPDVKDCVCEAYLRGAGLTPDEVAEMKKYFLEFLAEEQPGQVSSDIEEAMSTEM